MNCLKINFTGNFPANALGPFIDGWEKNFSDENNFFCEIA
jgi:hypothetical protein|tara:strand:+ start:1261 stop:1380 length:120 start_codon:yes stop_codon:yes gene_type:complete